MLTHSFLSYEAGSFYATIPYPAFFRDVRTHHTFQYYDTALDACLAVQSGKADAAAYDEPILKNIAAKNPGLAVLPDMITTNDYGFAVRLGNQELKDAIDKLVAELRNNGKYEAMLTRWLPEEGAPGDMPDIALTGDKGVLKFGTAAVTEPFSFPDANQGVVGFDIELATLIAHERAKEVLFSEPYYTGGIAALVRE